MSGPIDGPADLTPLQRKYLGNVSEYCQSPPTLGRMYAKSLPQYVILLFLNGLLLYFCLWSERYHAASLVTGILVGSLVRDLGMFRRSIQIWPALAAIVDRERLAAILHDRPTDTESDDWS